MQWLVGAYTGRVNRRHKLCGEVFKGVRRGWCLGGEQFRQELLAQVDRQLGALHFGAERAESQAGQAERLVQEELKRLGWTEADLAARRKGDPDKVRLAQRVAGGYAGDAGVDCRSAANGQRGLSEQPAVSAAEGQAEVGDNRT